MNPPNTKFIKWIYRPIDLMEVPVAVYKDMVNYSLSYSCLQLSALLITTRGAISFSLGTVISVISMQALHCIFTDNIYILCTT